MSLQIWRASEEQIADHLANCEKPCCPTCSGIFERQAWYEEIKNDERLAREAEQDCQLDEFEVAELRREQGLCDYESDDLRCGDLPR